MSGSALQKFEPAGNQRRPLYTKIPSQHFNSHLEIGVQECGMPAEGLQVVSGIIPRLVEV